MIRSLLKSRFLWQSIRTFSESKTLPPDFIDPKKLSDVIDNAVTEDDKFSTGIFAQIIKYFTLCPCFEIFEWVFT